jgi:hypothetical protein
LAATAAKVWSNEKNTAKLRDGSTEPNVPDNDGDSMECDLQDQAQRSLADPLR